MNQKLLAIKSYLLNPANKTKVVVIILSLIALEMVALILVKTNLIIKHPDPLAALLQNNSSNITDADSSDQDDDDPVDAEELGID